METALEHIDRQVLINCTSEQKRREIVGSIVAFAERQGRRVNVPACIAYIRTGKNRTRLIYDIDEVK